MKAYLYDEQTKEYKGETTCQKDPLESRLKGKYVYLLPKNATFEAPPQSKAGFKIKFEENKWTYEPIPIYQPTEEELCSSIRMYRDGLLEITDKTMLCDYPIAESERLDYKAYRTYLRNYTQMEKWWQNKPKAFEEWREEQNVETSEL